MQKKVNKPLLLFLRVSTIIARLRTTVRTIYISGVQPENNPDAVPQLPFATNDIKTSKYSILSFLPKNMFEQFRRVANFYFLINVIIIFATPDPPTSPYTSVLPLAFVVIVTAVKQAYEDVLRHKSDKEINNSPVRVLHDGKFADKRWKDVRVGDIIELRADEDLPL